MSYIDKLKEIKPRGFVHEMVKDAAGRFSYNTLKNHKKYYDQNAIEQVAEKTFKRLSDETKQ
jgi:hypothetical protein